MGKAVRRTLYLLACLTLAGVTAVCALTYEKRYGKNGETKGEQTEEIQAVSPGAEADKMTDDDAGRNAGNDAGRGAGADRTTGDDAGKAAGNDADPGTGADRTTDDDAGKAAGNDADPGTGDEKTAVDSEKGGSRQSGEAGLKTAADGENGSGQDNEETTIIITGDVLFGSAFRQNYDKNGVAGVVSEALLQELTGADVLLINNEFPFSTRGTPMEGKQYTFRCDPSYAAALGELGVDVVSLANNHTLDYGRDALNDTFVVLDESGIRYAGAGESAARAGEVQIIEANGMRIGILAATRVVPVADWNVENQAPGLFSCYDDTRLNELVAEAKENCDFLIVYPHWGVEYEAYPQDYQTGIARRCLASGADVVAGCHTHCLQSVAWIDGKPVFYSLGNFIFGRDIDRSAILKITLTADGAAGYRLLPVCAAGGVTALADENRTAQILHDMESISPGVQIGEDGTVTEDAH